MFGMNLNKEKKTSPVAFSEGRLTIDCRCCPGPSTVEDRQCLICICDAVKDCSELDSIMLHSSMDTSFSGNALDLIRDLAAVYYVLTMDPSDRRGSRCRSCRNAYRRIVSDQIMEFPDMDLALLKNRVAQAKVQTETCSICLGDSVRLMERMESMISDIRSSVETKEGE